jgi:hypothetical protein
MQCNPGGMRITWSPCKHHVIDLSTMKRPPAIISADQSLISHLSTNQEDRHYFLHIFSLISQFASFPREQTRRFLTRLLSRLSATDLVSGITAG